MNRITYYKFLNHQEPNRAKENAYIRSCILTLYAKYKKRLGAGKMRICLKNEYCINISAGRVYRLMKNMQLPAMSTSKPKYIYATDTGDFHNRLKQLFTQKAPNLVWVSDFTYLKAANRWYYLCVIIDLFSRKVVAWHITPNTTVDLVLKTFKKAYSARK